jgi:molecular chaperone IbpA
MTTLTKYKTASLSKLLDDLVPYSIGLDDYFSRLSSFNTQTNYPPYNLIRESDHRYRLEVAAAGFKSSEIQVYTENNQLVIEAKKEDKESVNYVYRSLSHRNFQRVWSLSDDVRVNSVDFNDGLMTVFLERVVPEHQKKKVYFG